jgi:hypothetical protein
MSGAGSSGLGCAPSGVTIDADHLSLVTVAFRLTWATALLFHIEAASRSCDAESCADRPANRAGRLPNLRADP